MHARVFLKKALFRQCFIRCLQVGDPGICKVRGASKILPTSADACGEVTNCGAGRQEVGMCSIRGGSSGMYIVFASAEQVNKAKCTLETTAEIQNRGTSGPKKGHVNVPDKRTKKKSIKCFIIFPKFPLFQPLQILGSIQTSRFNSRNLDCTDAT